MVCKSNRTHFPSLPFYSLVVVNAMQYNTVQYSLMAESNDMSQKQTVSSAEQNSTVQYSAVAVHQNKMHLC